MRTSAASTAHLSRRRFLTGAVGVVAATWSRPVIAFPLGLPPGLQLYTIGDEIQRNAGDALKQVSAMGYKEVETAGFGSLKTALEFRKALDDCGLRCPSAHLEFDLSDLQRTFDEAHVLGCTYATASVPRRMLQGPAGRPPARGVLSPMAEDEVKHLADTLNHVGEAAKAAGLIYASHNHAFEFAPMGKSTAYDYLLKHTDSALVKFEIDCGWATIAGKDPVDYLRRYPNRFRMVHMSDYLPLTLPRQDVSTVPPGAELGGGMVPYQRILSQIKGRGIEHIFVEQAGPFSRMSQMAAAKADYDYLAAFGTRGQ